MFLSISSMQMHKLTYIQAILNIYTTFIEYFAIPAANILHLQCKMASTFFSAENEFNILCKIPKAYKIKAFNSAETAIMPIYTTKFF